MTTVKCNRCLVNLPVNKFETKRCGNLRKLCVDCNLKNKTRFKCVDCIATFSSNSNLQTHINGVHLKLKSFKCIQCDTQFSRNSDLQQHINAVHLKIQRFKCIQCDTQYSKNTNLQQHINAVHLKIKMFACENCAVKFSSNCELQNHISAVHLKIQHFKCDICNAKFSQNSNLQTHINAVHLKTKPCSCSLCAYKCSQNGSLQQHIKTCTGELNCSAGEFKIMKVLAELNLEKNENYLYNTSFWNVKDKNLLRWDFIVNHNTSPMVIEYDGVQHYQAVRFGGSKEQAEKKHDDVKKRDKIKDDHCLANNIPILRIAYWDFDNIETLVKEFLSKNTAITR